jgi:hypothetical protein
MSNRFSRAGALALSCLLAFAAAACTDPGRGKAVSGTIANGKWAAPNRAFTLALPQGWSLVEDQRAPAEVIANFAQTAGKEASECFIQRSPAHAFEGADQRAANAQVATWGEPELLRHLSVNVQSSEVVKGSWDNGSVGNVQVASGIVASRSHGRDVHYHTRQFILVEGAVPHFYGLHCLVVDPQPGEAEDVEDLLDSLSFR